MEINLKHIVISRVDAIGDVMLTIPMAKFLKSKFPHVKITFLGNTYTKPILEFCQAIDHIIDYTELSKQSVESQVQLWKSLNCEAIIHVFPNKEIAKMAKQVGIKHRVGTNRRWFHWFTCNKLVSLSRKKSDLHEAELNFKLLEGLGITDVPQKNEIKNWYDFSVPVINEKVKALIDGEKTSVILHTKSKGSAREWGLENFAQLIQQLPKDKFQIILTGTEDEGNLFRELLVKPFPHVLDTSGKLSLSELVQLIQAADILVAASTGPLHIASALGKKAIGLYAPLRPMFPQRWGPLGEDAHALVIQKSCEDCRKTMDCACIRSIEVQEVVCLINGR